MIAALFVAPDGVYAGLEGVEVWDEARDARGYSGPWPVVAHPPCKRWGRFWHGSPSKPHRFRKGDDGGCFAAAIAAVRRYGGVLEHPADSHAWAAFGVARPPRSGGWVPAGDGGWTCCVHQGHYGHVSWKATWLYARTRVRPVDLIWGRGEQRLDPKILERRGYAVARRMGIISAIPRGADRDRAREGTPVAFRDVLLGIARSGGLADG